MKRRGHFSCHGRVQGVFFRASARDEAKHLGLTGWVRNCMDGSVEVVAEGEVEAVAGLLRWCEHGPPYAHVSRVEAEYAAATGEFSGFQVRL